MDKKERFKILRLLAGLTQAELASIVGLPQTSIGAMERGRYAPSGDTGVAIAKAFCVPFDYLYAGFPSADSKSSLVWIVTPPLRSQHVQNLINEVRALFPLFLEENKIDIVVPSELGDGGFAFLMGHHLESASCERRSRLSTEVELSKKDKILFSCLLLSDKRFVNAFKAAFKAAEIVMMEEKRLSDSTIDTFNIEVLIRMIPDRNRYAVATEDIINQLRKIREQNIKSNIESYCATQYLFGIFMEVTRDYEITGDDLNTISQFFIDKNKELGSLPESEIDSKLLISMIEDKIKSLGCLKVTKKPIHIFTEPEDLDYKFIKEWFVEKWLSSDAEKRSSLVEWIKNNSDFVAWTEKYEKEVREGKRGQIFDF